MKVEGRVFGYSSYVKICQELASTSSLILAGYFKRLQMFLIMQYNVTYTTIYSFLTTTSIQKLLQFCRSVDNKPFGGNNLASYFILNILLTSNNLLLSNNFLLLFNIAYFPRSYIDIRYLKSSF